MLSELQRDEAHSLVDLFPAKENKRVYVYGERDGALCRLVSSWRRFCFTILFGLGRACNPGDMTPLFVFPYFFGILAGFECWKGHIPPMEKRGLVLCDPPYERSDEYDRFYMPSASASSSALLADVLINSCAQY